MFGLASLKCEGEALHPDEIEADLSDAAYLRQLQAYRDWTGIAVTELFCVRSELLAKLR